MISREHRSEQAFHSAVRSKLLDTRAGLRQRLEAARTGRRRSGSGPETEPEDEAIRRENSVALEEVDTRGRRALEAIDAALRRLDSKTYGNCVDCGAAIPRVRIEARPTIASCASCELDDDSA